MVIIALSDIHSSMTALPAVADEIAAADVIVISGDITHFGGWKQADEIISELEQFNLPILALPGNCDTAAVNEYLVERQIGLHCRYIDIDSVRFVGMCKWFPCTNPDMGGGIEKDMPGRLDMIRQWMVRHERVVFVSHQPASGTTVSTMPNGRCLGSKQLRGFLLDTQPALALAGHVHEAAGVDRLGDTTLVNPGPFSSGCCGRIDLQTDNVNAQLLGAY